MAFSPELIKQVRRMMKDDPTAEMTMEQQNVKEWILRRRAYEKEYKKNNTKGLSIIEENAFLRAYARLIEADQNRMNNLNKDEKEIYDKVIKMREYDREVRKRKSSLKQKALVIKVDELCNYMDNYSC